MKLNFFRLAVIFLALASAIIGAQFYEKQLLMTNILLWVFVPDCPLYAVLGAIVLLFNFPKNNLWKFLVASGLAIYGSWTVFVLLLYGNFYFSQENWMMSLLLLVGHLGMVVGAFLVLPKKKDIKWHAVAIALLWFAINFAFDYFAGDNSTHPWIPMGKINIVILFTAIESVAWIILLYAISDRANKFWLVKKFKGKMNYPST